MEQQHPQPGTAHQERIEPLRATESALDHFGMIIFFVIVLEVAMLFGLNLYQDSRTKTLNTQLGEKKAQLASSDNVTINNQIEEVLSGADKLGTVLNTRVQWSNFYRQLDAVTPKNVKLTTFSLGDSGVFRADGFTPSLSTLATAMVAWTSGVTGHPTPFSSIILNSNGYTAHGAGRIVSFSVSGNVNIGALGTK